MLGALLLLGIVYAKDTGAWVAVEGNEDEDDQGSEVAAPGHTGESMASPRAFVESDVGMMGICCSAAGRLAGNIANSAAKANNYEINEMGKARVLWKQTKSTTMRELDKLMSHNNIMIAQEQSDLDMYEAEASAAYAEDKPLPDQESKRGDLLQKLSLGDLKSAEKMWTAFAKSMMKTFSKGVKSQDKLESKFLKDTDKRLKTSVKEHAKWNKMTEKKQEKLTKSTEKAFGKEEARKTAEMEELYAAAKEEAGRVQGLTESIATSGEDMNAMVETMLDGGNGVGLNSALDMAAQVEASYYTKTDMSLEQLENTHVINVGQQLTELMAVMKETYAELEESGAELDDTLSELGGNGNRALHKMDEQTSVAEKDISSKLKIQEKEIAKTEKEVVTKVQAEVEEGKTEGEGRIRTQHEAFTKEEQEFKSGTQAAEASMSQEGFARLEDSDATLKNVLGRKATEVASYASMNMEKVNQAFETEDVSASDAIETTQSKVDETTLKTRQNTATVETVDKLAKKLSAEVETFHLKGKRVTEKAAELLTEADASATSETERLQQQSIDVQKLLSKQAGTALKDSSNKMVQLNSESSDGLTALSSTMQNVKLTQTEFAKNLRNEIRPIQANILNVQMTMDNTEKGLKKMRANLLAAQTQTDENLGQGNIRIADMKDSILEQGKKEFADDRAYSSKIIGGAQRQIDGGISRMGQAANGETQMANQMLVAANEAVGQANNVAGQRAAQLGATYNGEEATLKQAVEFLKEAQNRMAKFAEARDTDTAHSEEWERARMELVAKVEQGDTQSIQNFDADHDELMSNLKAQLEKITTDAVTTLKDERTSAQTYFEQGRGDITQTETVIGGQYNSIEKRMKDFQDKMAKDTFGQEELGRAQQSIQGQIDDGTARVKQAGVFEKQFAEERSGMNRLVNDESLARDEASRQAFRGMQSAVTESNDAEQREFDTLRGAFGQAAGEIQGTARNRELAESNLRGSMQGSEQSIRTDVQHESSVLRSKMGEVEDTERKELGAVSHQAIADSKQRAIGGAEASQVGRDIESEARNVDFEAHDMKTAISSLLPNIDPTAEINLSFEQMEEIKKLMQFAQKTAGVKETDFAKQVQAATDRIQEIIREGNMESSMMNKKIRDTGSSVAMKLKNAESALQEQKNTISQSVRESTLLGEDIGTAIDGAIGQVSLRYDATAKDVGKAESVGQYQGAEALEKVYKVLQGAKTEDDRLTFQKDKVIMPAVTAWRKNVESVFSSLGFALDLDRVNRMANSAEAADEGGILSARESLNLKARQQQKALRKAIADIKAKAAAMIAAVMANANLSEAEKRSKIAALRSQADASIYALQVQAQRVLDAQHATFRKIHGDMNTMDTILQKAQLLGSGSKLTREEQNRILDLQGEIKKNVAILRGWATNGGDLGGQSFLQVGAESDEELGEEMQSTMLHAMDVRLASAAAEQKKVDKEVARETTTTYSTKESEAQRLYEVEDEMKQGQDAMIKDDAKWDRALAALPAILHN